MESSATYSRCPSSIEPTVQTTVGKVMDERFDSEAVNNNVKGFSFWMIFVAICVSMFMSALEFVSVHAYIRFIAQHLSLLVIHFNGPANYRT